tara:strand:- start:2020 stop:3423 length:1404 start_codon:yes stop_codon:yes gene_type:complete
MRLLIFLGLFWSLQAQNKQLLYGFEDIPQQLLLNPGTNVDYRAYIGFPLLSNINFNIGMSGVSTFDLFAKDGIDFNEKLRAIVSSLDAQDFFGFNQQIEFFSAGIRLKTSLEESLFLSFGMYQESDVFFYFPEDFVDLAYEGNYNNLNRYFNLSDLSFNSEVLSVFHVGINKKINSKWTVGMRGKVYSSIVQASSTQNQGFFTTEQGTGNTLKHVFDLDMKLQTSGLSIFEDTTNLNRLDVLKKRILLGGDLGLGFDVGFTYQPRPEWTIDASLQDIGAINYNTDPKTYILDEYLEYEGINPEFPEFASSQNAQNYWDVISDSFDELFETDSTLSSYTKWRPIKLNSSVSYNFGKKIDKDCNCLDTSDTSYQNRVGAHLFAMKRPKHIQWAFSAFYYRKLLKGLQLKTTYTVDSYSFKNIGLGIATSLGPVQFFVMADNLLEYQNLAKSQSVSLQLGFNYKFKNNEN